MFSNSAHWDKSQIYLLMAIVSCYVQGCKKHCILNIDIGSMLEKNIHSLNSESVIRTTAQSV